MSSSTTAPMALRMLMRCSGVCAYFSAMSAATALFWWPPRARVRLNPVQLTLKGTDVIRALDLVEFLCSHRPSPPS